MMFKNFIKLAIRNLKRHKAYSIINILGLAIGITCCFLIVLYVINELSYDRFHEHADQIYRATMEMNYGGETMNLAATMAPLGPALMVDYPEVLSVVRVLPNDKTLISYGEKQFIEERFFFADSTLFQIFTFPLLVGNPETALRDPFSVIITQEMATKYFGDENPIGKQLLVENEFDFTVTGILQEIPLQTQLNADFFASYESAYQLVGADLAQWGRGGAAFTYLLLENNTNPQELEQKIPDLITKHANEFLASIFTIHIQPLKEVYLYSNLMGDLEPKGSIIYIYIFSAIAGLILVVACINFMNLTTARSMHRAREVGMRKTLGAQRSHLIRQFLGESITFTLIAVLIAIVLCDLALPYFGNFLEKDIIVGNPFHSWIIPVLIGTVLVVGVVAGSYPAFYLSRFQPVQILKSGATSTSSKSVLRKILVVFQFSISITLIICTVIIISQMSYIKDKEMGFDREHVVILQLTNPENYEQYDPLKQEFLKHPNIISVSGASAAPACGKIMKFGVMAEEIPVDDIPVMFVVFTDYEYIPTLGIKLVSGRNFSREFSTDANEAYIINQAAVRALGWTDENALGKEFSLRSAEPESRRQGKVIGVISDFHLLSLHEQIEPLFMTVGYNNLALLAVRISPNDITGTLDFLEKTWNDFGLSTLFEYSFIDDNFDQFYRADKKLNQMFYAFSILAIFIACLGLFGLTAFAAEQRTKEIGIRKILGASIANIVGHLSKEFVLLVIIANLIAAPVAYYAMNKWLQNFAYHIDIHWIVFVIAALIALAIAVATMSLQTVRAALSNPVDTLRYE